MTARTTEPGAPGAVPAPTQVAAALFDALQARDLDAHGALLHDDVVDDFVAIGVLRGPAAVRAFFDELFAAVPELRLQVRQISGADGGAVVQWELTGTFDGGSFQGIHATGRRLHLRGVDVMRIEDGKLRHNTIYYDGLAFARQVGLLPAEGSRGDKALTTVFNLRTDLVGAVRRTRERT